MSLKGFVKGIGHSIEKGVSSAKGYLLGDKEHPDGGVYFGTSTSTDMGYDLEGKNTALTMGEMENGGYTEMFGNNTAYNENEKNEKSTWDYIEEYGIPAATALAETVLTNQYNKKLQREQNAWNAEQAELNRQFNAAEAEKARQYETNMANTAHQREMTDLLATGLNPVNTATGGGGAATPGGSAASGTPAAGTNPAYMDHTALSNSALSLAETAKALKEMPYIAKEKKAQIANAEADTLLKGAETTKTGAETRKTKAEIENIKEQKKIIQQQLNILSNEEKAQVIELARQYQSAKTEEEKRRLEEMFYKSGFGAFMHHIGTTLGEIGQIIGAGGKAVSGKKGGITINNNTIN